jgi:hypothetical protein
MEEGRYVEFLEFLIKGIVKDPGAVKVDKKVDERGVLLTLKVGREDMGVVIGKQGSTARSIRTLVRIVGLKNNAHVNLKIEEPEGGRMAMPEGASAGSEPEAEASEAPSAVSSLDQVVEDLRSS